jgi:hypothetical protein
MPATVNMELHALGTSSQQHTVIDIFRSKKLTSFK